MATRQSLQAQLVAVMVFAADAFWHRQLLLGSPGEEPRFYIFVADVMARFHLTIRLAYLSHQSFLIGDIGFNGI